MTTNSNGTFALIAERNDKYRQCIIMVHDSEKGFQEIAKAHYYILNGCLFAAAIP